MIDTASWQDANTRYMSAAVAWIRATLEAQAQKLAAHPSAKGISPEVLEAAARNQPEPEARPPSIWSRLGFQKSLPSVAQNIALLPPTVPARGDETAHAMQTIEGSTSPPPALIVLSQRLGLTDFERSVLLLCAAMELDTSVADLCARAQGDRARAYPTFALALAMFPNPAWDALSPERPLRHWRLLEISQPAAVPLSVSALRADERIINFLKGVAYVDDRLAALISPIEEPNDEPPPSQRSLATTVATQLKAALPAHRFPVVQLLGTDSASKLTVAALVSRAIGAQTYRVQLSLLPTAITEVESFARLWERECLLLSVSLYLEVESDLGVLQTQIVDYLLDRLTGVVFLASRTILAGGATAPIVADVSKPTSQEQTACWKAELGLPFDDLASELAEQFNLDVGTIKLIVSRAGIGAAADRATARERLWDASRNVTRPQLGGLAHRVVTKLSWDDIVLPDPEMSLLHRIADQVGVRAKVYQTWGFSDRLSRGLGISVLFAGPSGCGKTLGAEVIANELQLDLFRIDLSAVVSKYIGETEKNLRSLFDAAEDGGAILFFDEADALFGKRSEVKDSHDRYANIEINYLLQRMESYAGLAILATNVKSAIDQAFLRRLRFVVDFPFPAVAERKAMWQRAFPPKAPTEGLDFDRLARLSLTGGNIALIALNAAFRAAKAGLPISMQTVLDVARIEFRKLARPVNEADFRSKSTARVFA